MVHTTQHNTTSLKNEMLMVNHFSMERRLVVGRFQEKMIIH